MKIKILVALLVIATIISLSCNWFRSKKNTSNPLIGEWRLDSVKQGKDSSTADFLIVAAMKDSAGVHVSFTKDSIFTRSKSGVDTEVYSFDQKANQLILADSVKQRFGYKKVNDSLVTLTSDDSAVLYLKK